MRAFPGKLPFGKKLQASSLLVIVLMTLTTVISLSIFMFRSQMENLRTDGATLSTLLADTVSPALAFLDTAAAENALATLSSVKLVTHAELYDQHGNLFARYARTGYSHTPPEKLDEQYPRHRHGPLNNSIISSARAPGLTPENDSLGTLLLEQDLNDVYRDLAYQVGIVLLIGLIGIATFYAMIFKLQQMITSPLSRLAHAMRNITADGFQASHIHIESDDEIGELSDAYNRMLDELSTREQSLRHELVERRKVEAKLAQLAHFDPVSKLPNRNTFNGHMEKALIDFSYQQIRFAVMYIDLDNFKYANDTFGHHAGDLILEKVGKRFRESLRREDFICRLGGDEFSIIVQDFADRDHIAAVAQKILDTLKQPFLFDGSEIYIGASIGIAVCPFNSTNRESLQRHADMAMYQAKKQGKNTFKFYEDEFSKTQKHRVSLESSLRRALEDGEISVHYQPIVNLSSRKVVGFESLARWINSDGKAIGPDEFIPIAEEIGLISQIGDQITNQSATQAAVWVAQHGPLFIAVNVSIMQFKTGSLAASILDRIRGCGLSPENFIVEITESVMMEDTENCLKQLELMVRDGITVALDDFGTGYSSLGYLTRLPIRKIKIDKSFTRRIPDDRSGLAVVSAIISMAHSLGMEVVAEGIETDAQLACLTKLGCNYGQGYLFSKPVPAAEATRLLDTINGQT